jgi:two-component system sensor histidine kinase BaeS
MSETAWRRSLFWRIALGFVAALAAVLLAQAAAVVWLVARSAPALTPDPAPVVARELADELAADLADDPLLDLDAWVQARRPTAPHPFVVVTRHRIAGVPGDVPPSRLVQLAERQLRERRPGRWPRMGGPGPRWTPMAPVEVAGERVGVVVVDPRPRLAPVLTELGPVLALVALGLLVAGTGAMAYVVFRPMRRRLGDLEDAAVRLGGGDRQARAREDGRDEIAALARTFNQMAASLADRERALVEAGDVRRRLLADVSHELMTPLTSIRGFLETLQMGSVALDDATRQRYLAIAQTETGRLERIVGDLVDLARLEGGGLTLRRERLSVADALAAVAVRYEPAAKAAGVALSVAPGIGPLTVEADPLRLDQALDNLVRNALRHTPAGGHVDLGARRDKGQVVLTVADSGSGIAPDDLPRVFDRFYRADTAREDSAHHSGLGLSIVKAIVEAHTGSVAVTSAPGRGSTFEMRLSG